MKHEEYMKAKEAEKLVKEDIAKHCRGKEAECRRRFTDGTREEVGGNLHEYMAHFYATIAKGLERK